MEETPDPAESQPVTPDDRSPLGVRVIAGVMLATGVHSIVGHALNWWTEWDMSWNFSFLFIPLAWGLLRRREWARIGGAIISILGSIGCLLLIIVWASLRSGWDGYYHSAGSIGDVLNRWNVPITLLMSSFTLGFAFRTLELGTARDWFRANGPRGPWVEWNPLRWRFSVEAMLFITALFAMVTFQLVYHPSVPYKRGERWIANQDTNDPVYFPSGARYRVRASDGVGWIGSNFANGKSHYLVYATLAPADWNDEPTLVCLIFEESVSDDGGREPWQVIPKDPRGTQSELLIPQHTSLTLPDDGQIIEIVDGKPRASKLRITVLELWSYLNSDALRAEKADRSLEALEKYIKDLRIRVAERDAARSVSP